MSIAILLTVLAKYNHRDGGSIEIACREARSVVSSMKVQEIADIVMAYLRSSTIVTMY